MFDEWLRLFWKTFLWWLPGGDDDSPTSHGKDRQQANQNQDATSTAATGAASTGADQAPASARAPAGESGGTTVAKGGNGAQETPSRQSETKGASPSGSGQDGARAKSGGKPSGRGASPAKEAGGDDLTAIKGIGPTLSQRLYGLGILSYADLVKADPEDLAAKVNQRTVTAKKVRDWIADAKSRMD